MKQLFTLTLAAVMGTAAALADATMPVMLESTHRLNVPRTVSRLMPESANPYRVTKDGQAQKFALKAQTPEEEMPQATIKVTFVTPYDDVIPQHFQVFNYELDMIVALEDWADYDGAMTITTQVPAGKSDLMGFFWSTYGEHLGYYGVIQEEIEITDGMELTIDAATATCHTTFSPLLPNGQEMVLEYIDWHGEIGDFDNAYVTPGNVDGNSFDFDISFARNGDPFTTIWYTGATSYEHYNTFDCLSFYSNPGISENYTVYQQRRLNYETGSASYFMTAFPGVDTDVTVGVDEITPIVAEFVNTPAYDIVSELYPHKNTLSYKVDTYNGWQWFSGSDYKSSLGIGCLNKTFYLATKDNAACRKADFRQTLSPGIVETIVGEPYQMPDLYTITGAPSYPYENGVKMLAFNYGFSYSATPLEAMSYTTDQALVKYAASAPALMAVMFNFDFDGFKVFSGETLEARGIRYESRESDILTLERTATLDGQPTTLDEVKDGVYEVTYTDTNITVDGLKCKTFATVTFDSRKADWTPPTITMVQTRDAQANVTNKVDTPDDLRLAFTACDIELSTVTWEFEFKELASVKAEYSPSGYNRWTELAVTEMPENFSPESFGYYYSVAADAIDRTSANGWYDLRLTLEDLAGNTHCQTIELSFYIDSLAGLEAATAAPDRRIDAIYNLQGHRIDTLAPGLNIVRYTDGTVTKIAR